MDFKRLGTQSGIYAKRNLSPQKFCLVDGAVATFSPRQEVTLTTGLLKQYSLEDLLAFDNCETPKFNRNELSPERDIKSILEVVKCDKNVLFFHTDFIFSKGNFLFDDMICAVEPYLNECFSNLFTFRDNYVPDKDTFLAVIVQGFLCFATWNNKVIQFKEYVPLSKSSTFIELYRMIGTAYTSLLKIR